jgi:hypothetical protein
VWHTDIDSWDWFAGPQNYVTVVCEPYESQCEKRCVYNAGSRSFVAFYLAAIYLLDLRAVTVLNLFEHGLRLNALNVKLKAK